jgi:hypothetical protein
MVYLIEHYLSTVNTNQHNILCSIGYLSGKEGKGIHTNEKQLHGGQKKKGDNK